MINPLVSIIVPCYGMGEFIGDALASVGAQTYSNWEVIAVDDCGPKDGTKECVLDFASRYLLKRVHFARNPVNLGVSVTRNAAIAQSKGEYLAFLDPDDLWEPAYLSEMIAGFQHNPEGSAGVCCVKVFEMLAQGGCRETVWIFQNWQIANFPTSLATNNFIQPSAAVVKRQAIVDLGGFDVTPALQHIEDYDLWIRLIKAGHSFFFVNKPLCRYRKHPSAATSDKIRMAKLQDQIALKHPDFFITSLRGLVGVTIRRQEAIREAFKNPIGYFVKKLNSLFK